MHDEWAIIKQSFTDMYLLFVVNLALGVWLTYYLYSFSYNTN